jgi:hypothetical protein
MCAQKSGLVGLELWQTLGLGLKPCIDCVNCVDSINGRRKSCECFIVIEINILLKHT